MQIKFGKILNHCNFRFVLLAILWTIFFTLGVYIATVDLTSEMVFQNLSQSRLSIAGLIVAFFLPFLISAFFVFCDRFGGVCFIASIKAVLHGYSLCGISRCFGNSGWLVYGLFAFSAILNLMLLFWIWLRYVHLCLRLCLIILSFMMHCLYG